MCACVCVCAAAAPRRAPRPQPASASLHSPPSPPMQRGPPAGQGWPWGLEKHGNGRAAGPWAQAPAPPRPLPGGRRRVSPAQRLRGKAGRHRPRSENNSSHLTWGRREQGSPRTPSSPPHRRRGPGRRCSRSAAAEERERREPSGLRGEGGGGGRGRSPESASMAFMAQLSSGQSTKAYPVFTRNWPEKGILESLKRLSRSRGLTFSPRLPM